MNFFLPFFFFIFTAGNSLLAQPGDIKIPEKDLLYFANKIDSLPLFISSGLAKPPEVQCPVPGHLRYYLKNENLYFSEQALNISKEKKATYIRMYALEALATDLYYKKDYAKSTKYFQAALAIALKNNFTYEELHNYRPPLNNNYFLAGDYTSAMKISAEGLAKSERIRDTNRIIHFDNVIGYIHMKQKNFSQAEQYFSRQLHLSIELKNSLSEAHALYNMADLLLSQQSYNTAIVYLKKSITVYRTSIDSNLFILPEREAWIFNKMAEAYKLKGDYENALQYALSAMRIVINNYMVFNEYDKASYFINSGDIYNRLQKPDSAIFSLRKGLFIAQKIFHKEHTRDAYEQLSLAFSHKKMFDSAWFYNDLFSRLRDSIESENDQREIYQREAILQIEGQQQQYKISLERQKTRANIIIGIAFAMLAILYLLYNRYRLKQKNKFQAELNRQQQEILNTTITVQDQERKRIAEDLHDGLGSILSAAKLKLSAVDEDNKLETAGDDKLKESLDLLDEAVAEMKNIAYDIMPATLSRLGLIAALQNLFNRISNQSGLKIDFSTHGFTDRLDESTELSIYRIILESTNNVVKHACAKNITVQLLKHPGYINITIEDDGKGFTLQEGNFTGNGLSNIASRIKNLKGSIDIDSKPGNGTTIFADIPYGDNFK